MEDGDTNGIVDVVAGGQDAECRGGGVGGSGGGEWGGGVVRGCCFDGVVVGRVFYSSLEILYY